MGKRRRRKKSCASKSKSECKAVKRCAWNRKRKKCRASKRKGKKKR